MTRISLMASKARLGFGGNGFVGGKRKNRFLGPFLYVLSCPRVTNSAVLLLVNGAAKSFNYLFMAGLAIFYALGNGWSIGAREKSQA